MYVHMQSGNWICPNLIGIWVSLLIILFLAIYSHIPISFISISADTFIGYSTSHCWYMFVYMDSTLQQLANCWWSNLMLNGYHAVFNRWIKLSTDVVYIVTCEWTIVFQNWKIYDDDAIYIHAASSYIILIFL